jgi:hypothetical protein
VSIVIQNMSTDSRATGPHDYEFRINRNTIAKFVHNREDGLAECLRKAALAAEDPNRYEVQRKREALDRILSEAMSTVDRTGAKP